MLILDKMEQLHITQKGLGEMMGCTQQFVTKILKGQENLTFKILSKIERALDLELLPRCVMA